MYFVLPLSRQFGRVEGSGVEVVTRCLSCEPYIAWRKLLEYQLDPQVTFNLFISVIRD